MAKLSNIKFAKKQKPFVSTEELTIITNYNEQHKITGFTVTKRKELREFFVVKNNILEAWQQVEEFCKDLK